MAQCNSIRCRNKAGIALTPVGVASAAMAKEEHWCYANTLLCISRDQGTKKAHCNVQLTAYTSASGTIRLPRLITYASIMSKEDIPKKKAFSPVYNLL